MTEREQAEIELSKAALRLVQARQQLGAALRNAQEEAKRARKAGLTNRDIALSMGATVSILTVQHWTSSIVKANEGRTKKYD